MRDWGSPLLESVIPSAPYIFATATQELGERVDEIVRLLLQDDVDADHFLSRPPDSAWNSLPKRSPVNLCMIIGRERCCKHVLHVLPQSFTAAAKQPRERCQLDCLT
jgi:hypothetical protein